MLFPLISELCIRRLITTIIMMVIDRVLSPLPIFSNLNYFNDLVKRM